MSTSGQTKPSTIATKRIFVGYQGKNNSILRVVNTGKRLPKPTAILTSWKFSTAAQTNEIRARLFLVPVPETGSFLANVCRCFGILTKIESCSRREAEDGAVIQVATAQGRTHKQSNNNESRSTSSDPGQDNSLCLTRDIHCTANSLTLPHAKILDVHLHTAEVYSYIQLNSQT